LVKIELVSTTWLTLRLIHKPVRLIRIARTVDALTGLRVKTWHFEEAQRLSIVISKVLLILDLLLQALDLCDLHDGNTLLEVFKSILVAPHHYLDRVDCSTGMLCFLASLLSCDVDFSCTYAVVHEDLDHPLLLFPLLFFLFFLHSRPFGFGKKTLAVAAKVVHLDYFDFELLTGAVCRGWLLRGSRVRRHEVNVCVSFVIASACGR
jgi:hypothetical protein